MTPPAFDDYVIDGEVTPAPDADLDALRASAERALSQLASGRLSRDDALLAYMAIMESAFYWRGWYAVMQSDAIEPAVDLIISRYPDDRPVEHASPQAQARAPRWWRPADDAARLLAGLLNARLGHLQACHAKDGTLILHPAIDATMELRNRWFDTLRFRNRVTAGDKLALSAAGAGRIVERIDRDIQLRWLDHDHEYRPPIDKDWYRAYCWDFADRAIKAQFEHVEFSESWGAMSRERVITALRPFYRRAFSRILGHLRVFKFLREQRRLESPVLSSTIEILELEALAAEVARATQLAPAAARAFVETLVRRGSGEEHKLALYPLLPMHGDRALLSPSVFVFSNLPAAREMAIARGHTDANTLGRARDDRYTSRAVRILRKVGFGVETELLLHRPDRSRLTDLDVVALAPDSSDVLVLQLKSFLTPSHLLETRRADKNITAAIEQCRRAEANPAITKAAIEARFARPLAPGWTLRQAIVVEAHAGVQATPPEYPVITLDWLELAAARTGADAPALWSEARTLPDAASYFASCAPAFTFVGDELELPHRVAVFEYASEGYAPEREPRPS